MHNTCFLDIHSNNLIIKDKALQKNLALRILIKLFIYLDYHKIKYSQKNYRLQNITPVKLVLYTHM